MSNINIMDASAILAYLQGEKGALKTEEALDQHPSWITSVNYCEVLSKLCEKGMPPTQARMAIDDIGLVIVDFDMDLAWRAAAMRKGTMFIGASLGDRACLALAERTTESEFIPIVYTTEQAWLKMKWSFKIVMVRPAVAAG